MNMNANLGAKIKKNIFLQEVQSSYKGGKTKQKQISLLKGFNTTDAVHFKINRQPLSST